MRVLAVLSLLLATTSVSPRAVNPSDAPRTIDIVANDEMKYSVTTIAANPASSYASGSPRRESFRRSRWRTTSCC
jgi:hypothetical protein